VRPSTHALSSRAPLCSVEGRAWLRMRNMVDGAKKISLS
jgi:hypothetical protein